MNRLLWVYEWILYFFFFFRYLIGFLLDISLFFFYIGLNASEVFLLNLVIQFPHDKYFFSHNGLLPRVILRDFSMFVCNSKGPGKESIKLSHATPFKVLRYKKVQRDYWQYVSQVESRKFLVTYFIIRWRRLSVYIRSFFTVSHK